MSPGMNVMWQFSIFFLINIKIEKKNSFICSSVWINDRFYILQKTCETIGNSCKLVCIAWQKNVHLCVCKVTHVERLKHMSMETKHNVSH